ncbi:flagellar basal body P-ring formation chaperone FlgA [Deferribacter abyssi]|uniref:flagellar basal body P-ring formation chaperone FlgA n=1 Tax=Deferribacter abyssi TaxID=213806 RepID=UPI003C136170
MKEILLVLLILLQSSMVIGGVVVIDRDCLFYSDVFLNGKRKDLICNLKPGDKKVLPRSFLYRLMRQNPKLKPKLDFSKKIIVKRKGEILTEDTLRSLVADLYRKSFPDVEINIKKVNMNKRIYFTKKNDLKLDFMSSNRFGSVYFLLTNGYKDYRIYAYIKGFKEVFVSKERIRKNEPISNKVIKKRMEITKILGEPILDINTYMASKTIPVNRIITSNYVIKKPDAFKGDYVKLIYKSTSIIAVTKGVLEQNAYIGDVIKVKNPSSGKSVFAKYVGDKRAIILDY